MKKLLLTIAVVAALALTSCQGETDYKAKGAEMARQLNELCDKQDEQAVLALDKSISEEEATIAASGDTAAIADFKEALKESKKRNVPYISALKVKNGAKKEEVMKQVQQQAMDGDIDMDALTAAANKMLEAEGEMKKGASKE